jgi:hypothetical protein
MTPNSPTPDAMVLVPRDVLERAYDTMENYYGNLCTYRGERTGGVLAGCPRAPDPTPEQLVTEARAMAAQLKSAVAAPALTEIGEVVDLKTRIAHLSHDRSRMSEALLNIQQRAATPDGWASKSCRRFIYDTATSPLKPEHKPEPAQ